MSATRSDSDTIEQIAKLLAQPKRSAYQLAKAVRGLQSDKDTDLFEELWGKKLMSRRRAYYLAGIAATFESLHVSERDLERIGWTRLALITPGLTADNLRERVELALRPELTVQELRRILAGKRATANSNRRLVINLSEQDYARAVAALEAYGASKERGRLQGGSAALMACCSPQKPGHFSRCCLGRDELAG